MPVLRDGRDRGSAAGGARGIGVVRPVLNAAAVMLTSYGNVPPERAAHVMDMLPPRPDAGTPVHDYLAQHWSRMVILNWPCCVADNVGV
jgi:hypothetical protein